MIINLKKKAVQGYSSPDCSVCDLAPDTVICESGNGETIDWTEDENGF